MQAELGTMVGELARKDKAMAERAGLAEALRQMTAGSVLLARCFLEPTCAECREDPSQDLLTTCIDLFGSQDFPSELYDSLQGIVLAVASSAGLFPRHVCTIMDHLYAAEQSPGLCSPFEHPGHDRDSRGRRFAALRYSCAV